MEFGVRGKPCGRGVRVGLMAVAVGLIFGFILAARLEPAQEGFGTHRQWGFPECGFRMLFQRPCPACGMTTAFAHGVRGEWASGWRANPAGMVLVIVSGLAVPWCLLSAGTGRWWGLWNPEVTASFVAIGLVTLTLVVWIVRLMS